MTIQYINSPVGRLALYSDGCALVRLSWVDGETPDTRGDHITQTAARELTAYFAGAHRSFSIPLAPRGTDFQQRVWQIMQTIPYGATRTYQQVAERLQSGSRAVGTACGKNPLPLIIPCHRIVSSGGKLSGGYSGGAGMPTKLWLLDFEARGGKMDMRDEKEEYKNVRKAA